jgi:hypothetical protein
MHKNYKNSSKMKGHPTMRKMFTAFLLLLVVAVPAFAGNFNEGFEGTTFPPTGWAMLDSANMMSRVTTCSGYGVGTASVKADFMNVVSGRSHLITANIAPAAVSGDSIKFDYAHAPYSASYIDSLRIATSTNGGTTWTLLIALYGGPGGTLATRAALTTDFTPTASEWATKRYALPAGTNKVRFTAVTNIKVYAVPLLHDVMVSAINKPTPILTPAAAITPQIVVSNVGSSLESFNTTMIIDQVGGSNVYNQNASVSNLAAGANQTVNFPVSWTPTVGKSYTVTAYTQLGTDLALANDTAKMTAICAATVQRKQLVEFYTATSCPPCVAGNTSLDAVWNSEQRNISIIRTHVWWPTNNDPFYLGRGADSMENRARVTYYSISGVPACYVNGVVSSSYQSSVNGYPDTTRFEIKLSGWYMPASDTGRIKATMTWFSSAKDDNAKATYVLRYAVVEDSSAYTGTNGDPNHNQILRDMVPNNTGITITIVQGQTVADSQKFTVYSAGSHPYTWDEPRLSIIAYVQDNATKAVINSQNILLSELPGTIPLGVELAEFAATAGTSAITLSWRTASETDNYQWLIERSTSPDKGFTLIAVLDAANSPNGQSYSYSDNTASPLTDYYYRLGDKDMSGNVVWKGPILVTSRGEVITSVSLAPCRPNPCSRGASIAYALPKTGNVSLNVYDVSGRLVRTLESGVRNAGSHQAAWDLRNNSGRAVANGIYLYRLTAGNQTRTQKLTVIR